MAGCNKARADRPKMKTKRAAAKRFTKSGSGLIKYPAKGRRHGLSNKSRKRKRQLRKAGFLRGCDVQLVSRLIPHM